MSIAGLLRNHRKRKAIQLFLTKLGPALAKQFGKQEHYRPQQVRQAAQEAKLPMDHLHYGLSIYCTRSAFDTDHAAHGEARSYWETRVEVGEQCFGGNGAFTPQDVVAYAAADAARRAERDFSGGGYGVGGDIGASGY